jgi:NADPH2:quinone reductase
VRAVVISEGRVQWEERPSPRTGPTDLLVKVEAAGVNGADILQRSGRYPPPPGVPPDQPGIECAGRVEAVGEAVQEFRPGDRVMSLMPGAGQAELAVVPERLAMRVPDEVPIEEAGGFPETFATAHDALFSQAGLALGERLLVTGAAGGVGTAAVQLGVAAGATVIASARREDFHEKLAALGATPALPAEALALGPFDVVLELVGGPGVPGALGALAAWGRVVVIGTGAGRAAELDLSALLARRATVRGSTLRNRSLEEKALVTRRLEQHVLPLLASGRVRVPVAERFSFEEVEAAYERFAAGAKFGKVVLTMFQEQGEGDKLL